MVNGALPSSIPYSALAFGSLTTGRFSYSSVGNPSTCSDYELNLCIESDAATAGSLSQQLARLAAPLAEAFFPDSPLFYVDIRCRTTDSYRSLPSILTFTFANVVALVGRLPPSLPTTPRLTPLDKLQVFAKLLHEAVLLRGWRPIECSYLLRKLERYKSLFCNSRAGAVYAHRDDPAFPSIPHALSVDQQRALTDRIYAAVNALGQQIDNEGSTQMAQSLLDVAAECLMLLQDSGAGFTASDKVSARLSHMLLTLHPNSGPRQQHLQRIYNLREAVRSSP